MKTTTRIIGFITVAGLASYGATANSAGFALIEHGASGLGNAYAGASAVSSDTSTVWFNPAGMLELAGREISLGAHVIGANTNFEERGSTLSPLVGGGSSGGQQSDSPGGATFVPNLFYVHPINEKLALGFGITVPFGSSTEYDDDWSGRYLTVESGVAAIDFNPTIAYKLNDKVTLGGGISLQYMTATLANAVDSGTSCLGLSAATVPAPIRLTALDCVNAGLLPGNLDTDSYAEVNGASTALTFNLSALFKPSAETKIGVAYRHGIEHELDGDVKFSLNSAFQDVLDASTHPFFRNSDAVATANLPASLSFSVAHQAHRKLELLGDLTWTGWSSFEELRVTFDSAQPDTVSTQKWEDVIRLSVGANYNLNRQWTLRGGLAYDQEAIPSPKLRTPRIPGNDRTWLSVGAGYSINPKMSVDVGFAHLMLDETPIDNTGDAAGSQTVRGVYDSSVSILSAQFNWNFN